MVIITVYEASTTTLHFASLLFLSNHPLREIIAQLMGTCFSCLLSLNPNYRCCVYYYPNYLANEMEAQTVACRLRRVT